jgi:S1-C subfamily serine protease
MKTRLPFSVNVLAGRNGRLSSVTMTSRQPNRQGGLRRQPANPFEGPQIQRMQRISTVIRFRVELLALACVTVMLIAHPLSAAQKENEPNQETPPTGEKPRGQGAFLGAYITEDPAFGGIVIDKTVPDGPAAKAGLIRGDRFVMIGTKVIYTREDVFSALGDCKPGQKIHLSVRRGEKDMKVDVTLGKWPAK